MKAVHTAFEYELVGVVVVHGPSAVFTFVDFNVTKCILIMSIFHCMIKCSVHAYVPVHS